MTEQKTEKQDADNQCTDSGCYIKYNPEDIQYFGACCVIRKEFEYIRRRRGLPSQEDDCGKGLPELNLSGLALSGGGIRSASFSLGVMQALAHNGWLKNFDYLSTVSGGGYIGSSISWLLSQPMNAGKTRIASTQMTGIQDMMASQPMDADETHIARFGLDRKHFPYGTYPMSGSDPELRLKAKACGSQAEGTDAPPGLDQIYKGKLLRYLRQQAKYLTPGDGINAMSLVAVILRGAMVSLLTYFGLLLTLFLLIYPMLHYTPATLGLGWSRGGNIALWAALVPGGLYLVYSLIFAVFTHGMSKSKRHRKGESGGKTPAYKHRQSYERCAACLLTLTLALLIVGAVPPVYDALKSLGEQATMVSSDFQLSGTRAPDGSLSFSGSLKAPASTAGDEGSNLPGWIGLLSTLFGALSGVFAFFKSSSGKKGRIPMWLVVLVASAALWFGLLLAAYHVAGWMLLKPHSLWVLVLAWSAIPLAIALGRYANINYLGIHRYYRDRLMELFMPDPEKALAGKIATSAASGADKMPIHDLIDDQAGNGQEANPAPYHIINTNVVLESSAIPKFRGRGGDNFILSPYFCGSNATGWCRSRDYMDGRMTLPTAMAISGAAVNPGTGVGGEGVTRQPLLSMLMGLLNIRLGYWAPNPNPNPEKKHEKKDGKEDEKNGGKKDGKEKRSCKERGSSIPNFLRPGLHEILLRSRLNETRPFIQLTDGGHFENLALYELIRRHARLIVVCDGGADPDFQFGDLANAIEKIRVDFGTLILCDCEDLQPLVPRKKAGAKVADDTIECAERGYIMSTIIYPDNSQGRLLYLKTTFFEQLSADLYGYKKTHPQFPDEPTSDQFFDEKQFEAYRELGFQTAWRMMQDDSVRDDAFVRPLWANN
ncbi:MAG TPA: hypothetical protein ENJ80_02125 [Gammaproteobacteria bacterium]|nr:hypothetical protein [Gammaproteobacteria bacterium]